MDDSAGVGSVLAQHLPSTSATYSAVLNFADKHEDELSAAEDTAFEQEGRSLWGMWPADLASVLLQVRVTTSVIPFVNLRGRRAPWNRKVLCVVRMLHYVPLQFPAHN